MAAQQGFDMMQFAAPPPPPPPPPFGSPPGAQVYISHVGFNILFIDITIFSVNDMFYVIQFFAFSGRSRWRIKFTSE
jgi:hypothetical protein